MGCYVSGPLGRVTILEGRTSPRPGVPICSTRRTRYLDWDGSTKHPAGATTGRREVLPADGTCRSIFGIVPAVPTGYHRPAARSVRPGLDAGSSSGAARHQPSSTRAGCRIVRAAQVAADFGRCFGARGVQICRSALICRAARRRASGAGARRATRREGRRHARIHRSRRRGVRPGHWPQVPTRRHAHRCARPRKRGGGAPRGTPLPVDCRNCVVLPGSERPRAISVVSVDPSPQEERTQQREA
jgi:hypothetical protein